MTQYRCKSCGRELSYPSEFCLFCGTVNALCSAIYTNKPYVYLYFFSNSNSSGSSNNTIAVETYKFRGYDDYVSIRNVYEIIAERVHWRRIENVFISSREYEFIKEGIEMLEKCALTNLSIRNAGTFDTPQEFVSSILKALKIKRKLKKVELKPEDKIGGSHTTVIGGREGRKLLHTISCCEYVKKIVPGVIEGRGRVSTTGGVRVKLTRSDDRGNLRGVIVDGTSVQKILVVTTASSEEEGEFVRKILNKMLSE